MPASTALNPIRFKNFIISTLVLVMLCLFLVPDAMACHRGKPHGKDSDCGGPGPNPNPDPPPSMVETRLALEGKVISEKTLQSAGEARACQPGGLFSAAAGNYSCNTSGELGITVDSFNVVGVFSKKDYDICKALRSSTVLFPAVGGFEYGWTDSCTDGSCAVEIRLVFEGGQITDLTGGKSDLLDMVMHSTADTSGDANPDSNPFFNERELQITSVDLDYKKSGSTRSAATCTYYITPPQAGAEPAARLISSPVPQSP